MGKEYSFFSKQEKALFDLFQKWSSLIVIIMKRMIQVEK